ncbi:retrovirus-related pol polyprotein from transposon TNT 1-94 [Tanacetum coccineum]
MKHPSLIINFLKMIQVRLRKSTVVIITDNETEFVIHTLREYYEKVASLMKTSVATLSTAKRCCERRNRTLIEASPADLVNLCQSSFNSMGESLPTSCIPKIILIRIVRHAMASEQNSSGPALYDNDSEQSFQRLFPNLSLLQTHLNDLLDLTRIVVFNQCSKITNPHAISVQYTCSQKSLILFPRSSLQPETAVATGSPYFFPQLQLDQDAPSPKAIRIFSRAFAAHMNMSFYQNGLKTAFRMLKKALYMGRNMLQRAWNDMQFYRHDSPKTSLRHSGSYRCSLPQRRKELLLDSSIALTAFADADHAGCQDTRRSTFGSMQFLGDRLVSWSFKRQKSAAISSTEAEYIAMSGCYIRFYFIKEHVENGVIELYFVNTEYQLADIFTKAFGRERIEFLINKLGMRSFTPETLK